MNKKDEKGATPIDIASLGISVLALAVSAVFAFLAWRDSHTSEQHQVTSNSPKWLSATHT